MVAALCAAYDKEVAAAAAAAKNSMMMYVQHRGPTTTALVAAGGPPTSSTARLRRLITQQQHLRIIIAVALLDNSGRCWSVVFVGAACCWVSKCADTGHPPLVLVGFITRPSFIIRRCASTLPPSPRSCSSLSSPRPSSRIRPCSLMILFLHLSSELHCHSGRTSSIPLLRPRFCRLPARVPRGRGGVPWSPRPADQARGDTCLASCWWVRQWVGLQGASTCLIIYGHRERLRHDETKGINVSYAPFVLAVAASRT